MHGGGRGLTIVELLLTIALLATLTAIAIPLTTESVMTCGHQFPLT